MADVWVGSWRPHKPRGPIAALYSSPGPKYALPGLTGQYSPEHSGKSVYSSAPAYSLSGRSKDFGNDQTPGPAAYMLPAVLGPKAVTTSTAPNYSLCGRSKIGSFHEDLQKTPGPGAYKVIDPTTYKYKAPQYSIIGRNSISGDSTKKPGPGAHYPDRAPSFSFGVRHSQYIAPLIMNVAE
uniref:Tripartite motif containing 35-30 n=1 Tax=Myripristis murdjan TaxID=586833 RepID=A0A667ZN91_9TELE